MIVLCPHCGGDVVVTLLKQDCVSKIEQDAADLLKQECLDLTQECTDSTQIESKSTQICLVKGGVGGVSESGSGSDPQIGSDTHTSKFAYPVEFLTFWAVYPRKKNKGDAWKAWKQERPVLADLLNALSWQCTSTDWKKDGGQFVPYPGTYLRARGWEDEPDVKASKPAAIVWDHMRGAK